MSSTPALGEKRLAVMRMSEAESAVANEVLKAARLEVPKTSRLTVGGHDTNNTIDTIDSTEPANQPQTTPETLGFPKPPPSHVFTARPDVQHLAMARVAILDVPPLVPPRPSRKAPQLPVQPQKLLSAELRTRRSTPAGMSLGPHVLPSRVQEQPEPAEPEPANARHAALMHENAAGPSAASRANEDIHAQRTVAPVRDVAPQLTPVCNPTDRGTVTKQVAPSNPATDSAAAQPAYEHPPSESPPSFSDSDESDTSSSEDEDAIRGFSVQLTVIPIATAQQAPEIPITSPIFQHRQAELVANTVRLPPPRKESIGVRTPRRSARTLVVPWTLYLSWRLPTLTSRVAHSVRHSCDGARGNCFETTPS